MITEISKNEAITANDYIGGFDLSTNLSELTIKTYVHKIILSLAISDFDRLNDEIIKYYHVSSDHYLKSGNFRRKRSYQHDDANIDLIYQSRSNNAFMSNQALLILYQPNVKLMSEIDSIFKILSINTTLSTIELAWDFYSPFTFPLYEFLRSHLFLRYQRNPSFQYADTFYTNNIRKSAKGLRLYLRPKDSDFKDTVHLELEMHRPKIKSLNLAFPLTADQLDVDFRNYFDFRKIDFEKLLRYELKQCRKQIRRAHLRDPKGVQLLRCHIESWVTSFADEPLMRAVERLKCKTYGVANYNRFLVPMGELNMLIEEAAYKQRFGLLQK